MGRWPRDELLLIEVLRLGGDAVFELGGLDAQAEAAVDPFAAADDDAGEAGDGVLDGIAEGDHGDGGERDAPDDRASPVGTQTEGLDGYQNQRLHPSCIPASMPSLTFSHPNRSKK
jgi:hypothetical protein